MVIPLSTQHHPVLQRNLVYTSVTCGQRLVFLVGQPKALAKRGEGKSEAETMLEARVETQATSADRAVAPMRRKRTEAVAHLLVRRAAEADLARLGERFASIVTIEPPDYSLAREALAKLPGGVRNLNRFCG